SNAFNEQSRPYKILTELFLEHEKRLQSNNRLGIAEMGVYVFAGYRMVENDPAYSRYPEPNGYHCDIEHESSDLLRQQLSYVINGRKVSDQRRKGIVKRRKISIQPVTFADFRQCNLDGDFGK